MGQHAGNRVAQQHAVTLANSDGLLCPGPKPADERLVVHYGGLARALRSVGGIVEGQAQRRLGRRRIMGEAGQRGRRTWDVAQLLTGLQRGGGNLDARDALGSLGDSANLPGGCVSLLFRGGQTALHRIQSVRNPADLPSGCASLLFRGGQPTLHGIHPGGQILEIGALLGKASVNMRRKRTKILGRRRRRRWWRNRDGTLFQRRDPVFQRSEVRRRRRRRTLLQLGQPVGHRL